MKYIFGNWKMYLTHEESIDLAEQLSNLKVEKSVSVAVFPNTLSFVSVAELLKSGCVEVGAQNVAWTPQGAYTGATSAVLFKQAGANYAIVGHSERRHIFGESNDDVRKKLEACIEAGLAPVLCIGETEEDRDGDKIQYRLKKQMMKALEGLKVEKLMIAYEPVWAIGTGNACQPADAVDVMEWIKQEIKLYTDKEVPLLYGGSVNTENVLSYISESCIDGVLVGGASTKFDSFSKIIEVADSL